jgi:hypothetical protein
MQYDGDVPESLREGLEIADIHLLPLNAISEGGQIGQAAAGQIVDDADPVSVVDESFGDV